MHSPEFRDKMIHDVLSIVETTGHTLSALDSGLFAMDDSEEQGKVILHLTELSKETLEGCNEVIHALGGIPVLSTLGETDMSLITIDSFARHNNGVSDLRCHRVSPTETFSSYATVSRIRETYIRKLPKYSPPKDLQAFERVD